MVFRSEGDLGLSCRWDEQSG